MSWFGRLCLVPAKRSVEGLDATYRALQGLFNGARTTFGLRFGLNYLQSTTTIREPQVLQSTATDIHMRSISPSKKALQPRTSSPSSQPHLQPS